MSDPYTGSPDSSAFRLALDQLAGEAQHMHCRKSMVNTAKNLSSTPGTKNVNLKRLSLEQECLLTMMLLRAGLMTDDLQTSSVFIARLKFMSKELR